MIIGFTGKKHSGKTTAVGGLPSKFISISLADPVREVCKLVFGFTDEELNDQRLKETPVARWPHISPRQAMQTVGTDMFREHFPEVWLQVFKRRLKQLANTDVVVPDVRFLNEAETIRSLGGHIIRITRGSLDSSDPHPSEVEMDSIEPDVVLENSGSVDDLQTDVALVYSTLRAGECNWGA